MSDKNEKRLPTFRGKYENDLELIEKLLLCYAIVKNKPLRPFELVVLKYYIKYGYSDETKEYIMENENKKSIDLRVVNTHMRQKGYLNHGVTNMRKSELSADMEKLRNDFILDGKKFCVLFFERL